MNIIALYQKSISKLYWFNGIPALLLRLFLAPIMIIAGFSKLNLSDPDVTGFEILLASDNVVNWFSNAEWGLGLPYAEVLANLAAWTEFLGGWMLLIGLFTRLITLPLMFTMVVAATTVHLEHGWFAVAPSNSAVSTANVLDWLGIDAAQRSLENSDQVYVRLNKMREILAENGNTDWLFEKGNIGVMNNGIELAATYFIMLLALLFIGGGRFTSADYYLYTYWLKPKLQLNNTL
ncbi:HvfX family Cu-binding RiPP maturation protein [Thalassotalea hakodatensis]|uniref:HvfX family Cu-binding RiPP maturation protein n=1 Tax=Thalassotalea hakodatensis TaxID=3030492 RepID=UPI0025736E5A|nr:DoxX family protein [Thalassotalea hakodatensis]